MAQGRSGRAAGHGRICGAMQVHNRLLEQYPDFRMRLGRLEQRTHERLSQAAAFRAAPQIIKIPVVVHVVYRTAQQNITKAQIDSQITTLNRDYSAGNPDKNTVPAAWAGLVTDTNVQFALATTDPAGHPTDGVTRTHTPHASFDTHDGVKRNSSGGANAWSRDRYLN